MTTLILAAAFFLAIHLVVSGTPVRAGAVKVLGENAYMGVFSVLSLFGIFWLAAAYGPARQESAFFWDADTLLKHVSALIQLFAFCLAVPGLLTRNPASAMQEGALRDPQVVKGMLRITRHPFLWGVALWAAGHLLVNGDSASFVLFGSLLVLAVLGTISIDAKRKRALGEEWDAFAAQTSNLPFAAILSGRNSLRVEEIGWWRIMAGLLVFAVTLYVHELVGVSPLR